MKDALQLTAREPEKFCLAGQHWVPQSKGKFLTTKDRRRKLFKCLLCISRSVSRGAVHA